MFQRLNFKDILPICLITSTILLIPFSTLAQSDSLQVIFESVSIADTTIFKGVHGGFPNPVLSLITIKNQKGLYIQGLADTSRWLGPSDTTLSGAVVDSVWKVLLEYHQEDTTKPADPDIKKSSPEYMVTEVYNVEGRGISAALAMDYSFSMGSDIEKAEDAARIFVRQMNEIDRAAIIKFNGVVHIIQEFTSDTSLLINAISKNISTASGTAFYDALYSSIDLCLAESWRRAVIAYTDGIDNKSTHTIDEVIEYAVTNKIPVFTIGLGGRVNGDDLKRIADETGGIYKYAPNAEDLASIYLSIYGLLKGYYVLAHTSTDPFTNGTWRIVDITLHHGSATGRGKGIYYVPMIPPDLKISKKVISDSVSIEHGDTLYFAHQGDTISYEITIKNIGAGLGGNIRVVDFLADSVSPIDFEVQPAVQSDDSVVWNFSLIGVGETKKIGYRCVVGSHFSPWEPSPQVNSATVYCSDDQNPSNNTATDTLWVIGTNLPKPEIQVSPAIIEPFDSVEVRVRVKSDIKKWDLKVLFEEGTIIDTYADEFIETTTLTPDVWIKIEPDFSDTRMRTDKKKERVGVIFETTGFWNETKSDTAYFTIQSSDEFFLDENVFKPDDSTPLGMRFKLSSNRYAEINVYDLSGGFIKKVVSGNYYAGWNFTTWDGKDSNGNTVGSGIYIAILISGDFHKSRKFIVIR